MPLNVRKLPGVQKYIVDPKAIPENCVAINPSIADDIIYLRIIKPKGTHDVSEITLFNAKTSKTTQVAESNTMLSSCGRYVGLEDLRLIRFKGKLHFVATSTHASKRMQSETIVGIFSDDLKNIERLDYIDLGPPPVKNICPFILNDTLMLIDTFNRSIYSLDLSGDGKEGDKYVATVYKQLVVPQGLGLGLGRGGFEMRGSTSPVHLHGAMWGCIVHDIIYNDNTTFHTKNKLAYIHYYMEFDVDAGIVTSVSSPFFLIKFGIEFVSGISYDNTTHAVSLFLGVDDRVPCVVETTLYNLRA